MIHERLIGPGLGIPVEIKAQRLGGRERGTGTVSGFES